MHHISQSRVGELTFDERDVVHRVVGGEGLEFRVQGVRGFSGWVDREIDARLPEKGDSSSHGARPVPLIITMMKWIRTSRLSIRNSLSDREVACQQRGHRPRIRVGGHGLGFRLLVQGVLRGSGFGFMV